MRFMVVLLLISWALWLAGCGGPQASTSAPSPAVTHAVAPSPTARAISPSTSTARPATTTPVATRATGTTAPAKLASPTVAARPPGATAGPVIGQRFRIDQPPSRSSQNALKNIALLLRQATLTTDALVLRVAFQNTAEHGFTLSGGRLTARDIMLVEAGGAELRPTRISPGLGSIAPSGGFAPGGANVGELTFPRPAAGGPYELRVGPFDPVRFRLDTLALDPGLPVFPIGEHRISVNVHSTERALAPIQLRLQSVQVAPDGLTFRVAFVNTSRQPRGLMGGPKGSDAWLLDVEGIQHRPSTVSASLKAGIAPKDGWQPGEEYAGTLTFPRPNSSEMRFIFPGFVAFAVRFDAAGVAEARLTAPTGGPPPPTPAPRPDDVAFDQITQLLSRQAAALRAGDAAAYLASFAPSLRPMQERVVTRVAQLPFASYAMELEPDADLSKATSGTLSGVEVEVRTTLRDFPADNPFVHILRYDLARDGDGWRVTAVRPDDTAPFWLTGDVTTLATDHFLIVTRPPFAGQLPELAKEVETGYAEVTRQGLELDARILAFFAGTQQDFRELTGGGQRVLGIALSRYDVSGEAILVFSRAFFINGETFAEQRRLPAGERQRTIVHELVHLALAADSRPFTPPWLTEGAAVFFSGQATPEERRHLLTGGQLDRLSLEKLTRATTLGEHDYRGERVGDEYTFSGETVAHLIERHGEEKFLAFYRSFGRVPASQVRDKMPRSAISVVVNAAFVDLGASLTAEAVPRHFGLTLAQLDAEVKARVRAGQP